MLETHSDTVVSYLNKMTIYDLAKEAQSSRKAIRAAQQLQLIFQRTSLAQMVSFMIPGKRQEVRSFQDLPSFAMISDNVYLCPCSSRIF